MSTRPISGSQRWRRLIPLAFVTYSLAYVDRSNYSLGAAGGLTHALHITSGQVGLLGGLFFIGYFIFQVPAAEFAERRSVKRLMFWSLILWGIFAALQGVVRSFPLLLADRFALGVVEAAVIPAMLVFLTHWFSSRELGRADTFLILGNPVTLLWMSVISGYLIAATSYRWMFVIEGLPAIAWAFVFRALSADRPRDAKWLEESERQEIEERLAAEQADVPKVRGYREVLGSWNVRVLALQYALWSIGVYGFVFWLPTIVKSQSGNGIGLTGALSAVPYALAVVLMVANSYVSDRAHQRRRLFVWPFLILGAIAFYLSYRVGTDHFTESFVLLVIAGGVMYAPYGPYFAFIPEFTRRRDEVRGGLPVHGRIAAGGGPADVRGQAAPSTPRRACLQGQGQGRDEGIGRCVWSVTGPVGRTRTRVSPAQRPMEDPLMDVSDKPRWPGPRNRMPPETSVHRVIVQRPARTEGSTRALSGNAWREVGADAVSDIRTRQAPARVPTTARLS